MYRARHTQALAHPTGLMVRFLISLHFNIITALSTDYGNAARRVKGGFPGGCAARNRGADFVAVLFPTIPPKLSVDIRQTLVYINSMKYLNWNSDKNEILKRERGISFEEIAYLIESGQIIGIEENPSRPNQKMYILEIENYAIIVPCVENDNEIFLKTAFPSRKYTKRYGLKGE